MKALLVGNRSTLLQRVSQVFSRQSFDVREATYNEDLVGLLAQEPFDLLLLVAPGKEALDPDLISTFRDLRPAINIYVLSEEGALIDVFARLQPSFGKKVSINNLPGMLQEEIYHSDAERERFRLEWLKYVEDITAAAGLASTVRESAQQIVNQLHFTLQCDGVALLLSLEVNAPHQVVASDGDIDKLGGVWKDESTIYRWLAENQMPLLIRRGRSNIPGLQYDIVKFELGPSIFVPIVTSQRMVGFIALTKEPTGDPFPDSAFSVARIAADTFALRLESDQQVSLDEMRMMLVQEREQRQGLEDTLQEERGIPLRMSREIGNILDMAKGQPQGRSEAIAKLSLTLAENLELPTQFLQEAVFLRDMGILARPITGLTDVGLMPSDPDEVARDQANAGFEIIKPDPATQHLHRGVPSPSRELRWFGRARWFGGR